MFLIPISQTRQSSDDLDISLKFKSFFLTMLTHDQGILKILTTSYLFVVKKPISTCYMVGFAKKGLEMHSIILYRNIRTTPEMWKMSLTTIFWAQEKKQCSAESYYVVGPEQTCKKLNGNNSKSKCTVKKCRTAIQSWQSLRSIAVRHFLLWLLVFAL